MFWETIGKKRGLVPSRYYPPAKFDGLFLDWQQSWSCDLYPRQIFGVRVTEIAKQIVKHVLEGVQDFMERVWSVATK
jgi:hypothetical protein